MTLDDFEKSLANEKRAKEQEGISAINESRRKRRKHHHHHHHHHRSHHDGEDSRSHWRPKLSSDSNDQRTHDSNTETRNTGDEGNEGASVEDDVPVSESITRHNTAPTSNELKRDLWMEAPSTIDIDYTQKGFKKPSQPPTSTSSKADFALKIHDNELNKHHLKDLAEGKEMPDETNRESTQNEVDYTFGDRGAQWRMTKLRGVYRRAKATGKSVEDLAIEHFGDLRAFDDAREEQIELERRETYGEGYVGKQKPSGELFEERKLDMDVRHKRGDTHTGDIYDEPQPQVMETMPPPRSTVQLDQTALNRMKAQMMKAKLKGSPDLAALEAEYNEALKIVSNQAAPQTVVLGAMDNRMLAGGRKGEVKAVETRRGRERGLVEENEDMSIEDMVREERRTRNQAGGDSQRFAERIAKDAKFDVSTISFLCPPT